MRSRPGGVESPSSLEENHSLEVRAQKALACPCVAELRSGPCGIQFEEAFLCFMKSTAEEKGSDCIPPFLALQNCIKENPSAFGDSVAAEDGYQEDSKTTDKAKELTKRHNENQKWQQQDVRQGHLLKDELQLFVLQFI